MSSLTPINDPNSSDSGLALPKLARSSDESASKLSDDNPAHFVDSLSEIMNLNLADYYKLNLNNQSKSAAAGSKTAHSDMDYYSSPSKSSSNEFSSPESSSKLNGAPIKYQSKEARLAYSQLNKSSDFGSFCDVDKEEDEEEDSNKHVTKLFVGNLPTSTTLPELLAVFKKFGPVNEKLSVVKDQNYAFIHFYHRKDAQVALREVNDSLFKDRYIRVQFSTSQGYTNNKSKNNEKKKPDFKNYASSMHSSYSSNSISPNMNETSSFFNNNGMYTTSNYQSTRPITSSKMHHSHSINAISSGGNSSRHTNSFFKQALAQNQHIGGMQLNENSDQANTFIHTQQLMLYIKQLQQQQQQKQLQLQQQQQQQFLQYQAARLCSANSNQRKTFMPKSNTISNLNLSYLGGEPSVVIEPFRSRLLSQTKEENLGLSQQASNALFNQLKYNANVNNQ